MSASSNRRFGKDGPKLVKNRYPILPLVDGEKRPAVPFDWPNYRFNKTDVKQYADCGIGIHCGVDITAVDIDIRVAVLAEQCEKLTLEKLGPAPRRVGQPPKSALLYRLSAPTTHIKTRGYKLPGDDVNAPGYKPHIAEVLGRNQQLASYGRHPNGQEYAWSGGGEPLVTPVKDLTAVTPAQLHDCIGALEELIAAFPGAEPFGEFAKREKERRTSEPHEPNEQLLAKDPALLRAALAHIPNNDVEGQDWIEMVIAIKGALGDAGLDDCLAWSAKSRKNDPTYTAYRFRAARPRDRGAGSIFFLAQQHGWKWPISTDDATQQRIAELAKLTPIEYDRIRVQEAEKLGGIRRATLDEAVAAKRQKSGGHGPGITFVDPDPWQSPVNGAELLDDLYKMAKRYLVLPEHAATAIAPWALHRWCTDAFYVSPYLLIRSPLARCGKSTLMMVLEPLVRRPLIATSATSAAVFRIIEQCQPTLVLDEADLWLKSNEELRAILNGGHTRRSAYVLRTVGDEHEPKRFSTFCPKAFAGIGKLAVTLEDRSIVVVMKRKKASDQVERLRVDRFDVSVGDLQSRCLRWATDNLAALKQADPDMPPIANDRAADNWRPLIMIADRAGGVWPQRVRDAAMGVTKEESNDATGEQLLADIRRIFRKSQNDRIRSSTLAAELAAMEGKPWQEWGPQAKKISMTQVARLLDEFAINPRTILFASTPVEDRAKGYYLDQFTDAFYRYLPDRDPEDEANDAPGPDNKKADAPDPNDRESF